MRGLRDPLGGEGHRGITGVVIAIVTDNVCTESMFDGDYRVKVKYPTLPGADTTHWARIATQAASKDGVGNFFLPEVDDEVLVVFNAGDINQPVIIGCLWNGIDKPAYSNKDGSSKTKRYQDNDAKFRGTAEAKKNDIRSISTRKGHELVFNDSKDPRVVLSSGQKSRIVLDDKGGKAGSIEIVDGKEENMITIDTVNKKITIETKSGDMMIKAAKKITLDCESFELKTGKDATLTIGANYKMNATTNMEMTAGGTGKVTSSSDMTIKGSKVNIN